jgi:putative transposase
VVFAEPRDYERYLATLAEFKEIYGVKVYAYCLMTNHVHLLVAPATAAGLGNLMKRLAGRQTRYHNALEGRSGTLWESRYKSSPVDCDEYLLACARYIDLNPVRARMVAAPDEYQWSSCRHRLGMEPCEWLDEDPCFFALGSSDAERKTRYQEFLRVASPDGEWDVIRRAVQRGQLTGSRSFIDKVEEILGKRVEHRSRGRPAKSLSRPGDARAEEWHGK